ncbi:hypothetical protein [Mucilaginibacter flavidus]|uniref:hypothetical protein n=1 Tax=Mucilaginibacter flavidus TaxID=2949309 RepID=UPI002093A0CD|nr:hypothetical protein [Mucilaginibacter flavidus]MCO5948249.1 hypothetical protein [Mucilaginibacter flavidus]
MALADYKVVLYFFYIIIPLFFFYFFNYEVLDFIATKKTIFISLFLLCSAGIVYDYYFDFPWKGLASASIGGGNVDVSKDWTTGGIERIAGFSRSSYDAALAVMFFLILIICKYKNLVLIHIVFTIAFISIYLTTTKGCLVSLAVVYFVYITNSFRERFKEFSLKTIVILLSALMIILPLGLLKDFEIPFFNNQSFKDRIYNEWPFIMHQFKDFISYVLGLGIGDVGLGKQLYGNARLASPGDNFFIFLYSNLGLLAFVLFFVIAKRLKIVKDDLFKYMTVFLFSYGITTNILESPIGQLVITISLFMSFNGFAAQKEDTEISSTEFNYDLHKL